MKFHIPFTLSSIDRQKKKSILFKSIIKHKKKSSLQDYLVNSNAGIDREEYLNICYRNATATFIITYLISTTILLLLNAKLSFLFGLILSIFLSGFILFSQTFYPKIYSIRRQKNIEKNLLPALENILVQLSSGIPLYTILVNISNSDYGELSKELKKAVNQINAGIPQVKAIEDLGKKSSSKFFQRTLWQISNGMKAGSNMVIVVEESVRNLSNEQLIQIQNYGNKLNPLIMFYMMISVILPALSITFITVIASITGLNEGTTSFLFISLFVIIIIIQTMFLGIIRSTRPNLL
jgi:pilus assembly protein TadC